MDENTKNFLIRTLNILSWLVLIASMVMFAISLRSRNYAVEYSLIALGLWAIVFLLNYWRRKLLGKKFRL